MIKRKVRLTAVVFAAAFCLTGILSPAHAANWVRVVDTPDDDPSFIDIDRDSIRRGADGLVYFNAREDMGVSPSAVDCQKRVYYVIGDGTLDHLNHGMPIKPGTSAAKEADLVCA